MPTVNLQGTQFTFSILPVGKKENFWSRTEIRIRNEYIDYSDVGERFTIEELKNLLVSMSRLLAGGYERELNLSFDRIGIAVDLYAHTDCGMPVSRAERRENDCVAAIRILMRSKDGAQFFDGVYSILLHRKEIETLIEELWKEYDERLLRCMENRGRYAFVGVSPLGYKGCHYQYLDPTRKVKAGDYVWVRMGRHNIEQIVYVDGVQRYDNENAPYDPKTVKRVLRKATKEEIEEIL